MADNEVRIKVTADDQATREVGGIAARVKALAQDVKIKVDIDKDRIAGALADVEKLTAGFGNAALGASKFSLAIAAIGGTIGSLGPLVNGLATAIMQLSGLIGLVPAGLGMIAAAAATVMIAMTGTSAAFNQVKSAIQGLQSDWQSLANLLNQNLFAGIGKEISDLGRTYIPILRQSLSGMAADMNNVMKQVADFFKAPSVAADMTRALENIRGAFRNIMDVVLPLTMVFTDVFAVGAEVLREITAGAGNAAKAFAAMVSAARESGQLKQWIEGGVQALKNLWDIGVNVVGIIQAIFKPAGGDGANFLNTVKQITAEFKAWLNSPEIKAGLTEFWKQAQELGKAFMDFLRTIGPLLDPIVKIVGEFAKAVVQDLKAAFDALNPILKPILDFLAETSPQWGPAAGAIVIFGAALLGVSKAIGAINAVLTSSLVTRLGQLVGWLKTPMPAGGGVLGSPVIKDGKIDYTGEGGGTPVVTGASGEKKPATKGKTGLLGGIGKVAAVGAVGVGAAAAGAGGGGGGSEIGGLNSLKDYIEAIKMVFTDLGGVFDQVGKQWQTLVDTWNKGAAPIQQLWNSIVDTVKQRGAEFMAFWNGIPAWWNGLWTGIASFFQGIWNGIVQFLTQVWNTITTTVQTVWNGIVAFLTQVWTTITTAVQTAWNAVVTFLGTIWTNITTAVQTAWNAIVAFLGTIWTTITTALQTAWDTIVQVLQTTWDTITSAVQTAWDNFVKIIQTAIDTVMNAINTFVSSAISAINSVISAITGIPSGGTVSLNPGSAFGNASGGIIGSRASGGAANGMTLVGERGPELVRLPWGSMVFGAAQTAGMLDDTGGSGRAGETRVTFGGRMDTAMANAFMYLVRTGQIQIRQSQIRKA